MAADVIVQTGNLTATPERVEGLSFSKARFSIAIDNGFKKDSEEKKAPTFLPVEVTNVLAENVLASLTKGMKVVVKGRLRPFTTTAMVGGEERNIERFSFDAFDVAPSLSFGTVEFTRNPRREGGEGAPASKPASKPAAKAAPAKAAPKAAAAAASGW